MWKREVAKTNGILIVEFQFLIGNVETNNQLVLCDFDSIFQFLIGNVETMTKNIKK